MNETIPLVQCSKCGQPIPALAAQEVRPQCGLAVAAPTEITRTVNQPTQVQDRCSLKLFASAPCY